MRTRLLVPGLVFILVFAGLFFPLHSYYMSRLLDSRIKTEAARVSDILFEYRFMLNSIYLKRLGRVIEGQIALIDHTGRIMGASFEKKEYRAFSHIADPAAIKNAHQEAASGQIIRKIKKNGRSFLLVTRYMVISDATPAVCIAILTPLDDLENAKHQIIMQMIYSAAPALVAALIAAGIFIRKITSFFNRILAATQKIADGQFSTRVAPSAITALDMLAVSINKMAARLMEYEKEIINAARLKSSSQITAAMAHEIKNPLSGMKMLAQVIEKNPGQDPQGLKTVQALINEINRVDRLISDLNTLAAPPKYFFEKVLPEVPLNEIIPVIQPKLSHLNIRLDCDIDSPGYKILLDRDKIKQVLWNLMINGAQSMPQGGKIQVSMRPARSGEEIEYLIKDEGPGIGEQNIEDLFQPFYTTKKEGIGIGLHVSRQIARAHDGRLELVDTDNGTLAILAIPYTRSSSYNSSDSLKEGHDQYTYCG